MAFQCVVVTPEQQAFSGSVSQVILPAHDGQMGILTDRAPLLVKLGIGPLELDPVTGAKQYYLIDGGVAQMKGNVLTILTTKAIPSSAIDAEAARDEYAAALKQPAITDAEFAKRQDDLQRARAKETLAESPSK